MGGESVMSLVPCEPTGSNFSTPGFTRFQIQLNRTPSQCWEMETLERRRDSSLHHTLSSFIALFLGGSSKARSI